MANFKSMPLQDPIRNSSWTKILPQVTNEGLFWIGLVLVALVARLAGLGERGMSHDESLHALYSFYLVDRGQYVHDPMMHGPFLFHLNAFIYLLSSNVNDFTARLAPALAGTLVVGSLWWFRRYLGKVGSFACAVLLLLSPSLLFYSRYIRNDIYVVLFTICWIYALFRYIESGQSRWMLGMGLAMVLGFSSKENHFITGFVLGTFALGMGIFSTYLNRGIHEPMAGRYLDGAFVMLFLVLPFLAPLILTIAGQPSVPVTVNEQWIAGGVAAALALGTLFCAFLWFVHLRPPKWRGEFGFNQFLSIWATFWIIALLLFSTFFTNVKGLTSGVAGSLGYWISQQEVQRGSQPWYYYLMLTGFYEYLPFVLSLFGGVFTLKEFLRWLRVARQTSQVAPARMPILLQIPLLLVWWTLASWISYSFAGERMPWLLSHITAPMSMLGAFGLAGMISESRDNKPGWLVGTLLVGTAFSCGVALLSFVPFTGRELQSLRETGLWVTFLAGGIVASVLGFKAMRRSTTKNFQPFMLSIIVPLVILTARSSYQLNYINFDYVTEYLMYAHASPDVKKLLAELEVLEGELEVGKELKLAYDSETSWPLAWYFREYPNARLFDLPNPDLTRSEYPVIVASRNDREEVRPYVESSYVSHLYRLIWWPEEGYKNWSKGSLVNFLDPEARRHFSGLFFRREHPQYNLMSWPFRNEFDLYVRRDLAHLIWDDADSLVMNLKAGAMEPKEVLSLPLKGFLVGPYNGLQILDPKSVTVSNLGNRVITDSGNHRVLVLDSDNRLIRALGSYCPLMDEIVGPCVDPDEDGPLVLGDGQFNEPWGAAEAWNGDIVVADTWNHRLQAFDAAGNFQSKWGSFGQDPPKGESGALLFWGPRGLDIDVHGNIVVADTGNHRLVSFSNAGEWLATWQGRDTSLGFLLEPVDVSVDRGNGNLYLTDSWNGKLQTVSPTFKSIANASVPSSMWRSKDSSHKPYVAVIPGRGLVTSDPENGRLVFFDFYGEAKAYLDLPLQTESGGNSFPNPLGIAVDSKNQELLVVDQGQDRILIFDLASFLGF